MRWLYKARVIGIFKLEGYKRVQSATPLRSPQREHFLSIFFNFFLGVIVIKMAFTQLLAFGILALGVRSQDDCATDTYPNTNIRQFRNWSRQPLIRLRRRSQDQWLNSVLNYALGYSSDPKAATVLVARYAAGFPGPRYDSNLFTTATPLHPPSSRTSKAPSSQPAT